MILSDFDWCKNFKVAPVDVHMLMKESYWIIDECFCFIYLFVYLFILNTLLYHVPFLFPYFGDFENDSIEFK